MAVRGSTKSKNVGRRSDSTELFYTKQKYTFFPALCIKVLCFEVIELPSPNTTYYSLKLSKVIKILTLPERTQ